jgi:hypothetical protein
MKSMQSRCDYCGSTLTCPNHKITVLSGFTVVDCPKYPKDEKAVQIRTRVYRGGARG